MAIQLSTVLTAARDRHPAFHPSRVTNAVLARALTDYQRVLLSKALRRDKSYLAQQASVVFSGQDRSGAGVGGFPAEVANDGTVSRAEQPTGFAKELDTETAVVLVQEFVPTSSTSTSISNAGGGWTVSYLGQYAEITAGTGKGQVRLIINSTSTTLNFADALDTLPDSTSLVRVVSVASSVSQDVGVVTSLPAVSDRVAYLIKVDATGTAYIDLTDPLVARFDRGVPLPPFKHVLGGTVWFANNNSCPFTLTTFAERGEMWGGYTGYVMNRQLFLIGSQQDWQDVESIDLRYVPEPPQLTALTDYLLLPDHAQPALVAHAALVAGQRVQGLEGLPDVDVKFLLAERSDAETAFLREVGAQRQETISRVPEAW